MIKSEPNKVKLIIIIYQCKNEEISSNFHDKKWSYSTNNVFNVSLSTRLSAHIILKHSFLSGCFTQFTNLQFRKTIYTCFVVFRIWDCCGCGCNCNVVCDFGWDNNMPGDAKEDCERICEELTPTNRDPCVVSRSISCFKH